MNKQKKPSPRPVATLRHHTSALTTTAFSAIGSSSLESILSGDVMGTAAIWNLETRRVAVSWAPHQGSAVLKVQGMGNGTSQIITQGRDGRVKIWDAAHSSTGSMGQPAEVTTIQTDSYNFCKCASVRWTEGIQMNSQPGHTIESRISDDDTLQFHTRHELDHPTLYDEDKKVDKQKTQVRSGLAELLAETQPDDFPSSPQIPEGKVCSAESLVLGHSARYFVATALGDLGAAGLWDMRCTNRPVSILSARGGAKTGMALSLALAGVSSTGSLALLVGYESGAVGVFDLTAGRERARATLHSEPVLAIEVGPSGCQVATSAADNTVCICRLHLDGARSGGGGGVGGGDGGGGGCSDANEHSTGSTRSAIRCESNPEVENSRDESGAEVDANVSNSALVVTARLALETPGAEALAVRQGGGGILAVGGWDRRIRLFEWAAPHRPLAVLQHHTAGISAVSWSGTGAFLASASKDMNIALWAPYPAEVAS